MDDESNENDEDGRTMALFMRSVLADCERIMIDAMAMDICVAIKNQDPRLTPQAIDWAMRRLPQHTTIALMTALSIHPSMHDRT